MTTIEHDALKRFVKATEDFESRFSGGAVIGMSGPKTQTGETYLEYINGKRRYEYPEVFPTPDAAIEATFSRLCEEHPASSGMLQWRVKPEIDYSDRGTKGWLTYCRFIVTKKQRD